MAGVHGRVGARPVGAGGSRVDGWPRPASVRGRKRGPRARDVVLAFVTFASLAALSSIALAAPASLVLAAPAILALAARGPASGQECDPAADDGS